jgi:glycerol-3-phosphate acyltransferase PlsY
MTLLIALMVGAYCIGGMTFGVWIAKSKGVDILNYGSGNPGATNVGRALGRTAGLTVFVLDVAKGLVPVLIARSLLKEPVAPLDLQLEFALIGISAVLGHTFSPLLKFKGGKGVATSLGMVAGFAPLPALAGLIAYIVFASISRYVSLGSIAGALAACVTGIVLPDQSKQLVPFYLIATTLVIYLHRSNIQRILNGTERKIGQKNNDRPASDESTVDKKLDSDFKK